MRFVFVFASSASLYSGQSRFMLLLARSEMIVLLQVLDMGPDEDAALLKKRR